MNERPVDGVDELASAYRRLEAGEPPALVDASIRSKARAAARRRRAAAWTLPTALAATVLVAFSLVLSVQREESAPPPPAPADAAGLVTLEKVAPPAAGAYRSMAPAMPDEAPEAWLARIEVLEAAGRHEEAEAERQRLEAAHPGWLAGHAGKRD